jgi:protein-S-isoprenylcysteine O-methyltransferase Ste14
MTRVALGTVGYVLLFGVFLLLPAPSPVSWRAWALLGVLLVVRFVGSVFVYRVNPELLRERTKPPVQEGQPLSDRVLLLSFMTAFALLVSLASLDGLRLHLLGAVPPSLALGGMLLFVAGWLIASYALWSNAFAVLVVRPQERQVVVTAGAYRYVRHPIYLGGVAIMLGTSLWLQSYVAVIASAVPTAILVARIVLEERFIAARAPGYQEYSSRVRYRLLPFIW